MSLEIELRGPRQSIVISEDGTDVQLCDDDSLIPAATRALVTADNSTDAYLKAYSSLDRSSTSQLMEP